LRGDRAGQSLVRGLHVVVCLAAGGLSRPPTEIRAVVSLLAGFSTGSGTATNNHFTVWDGPPGVSYASNLTLGTA
jgi:hypothetical protein